MANLEDEVLSKAKYKPLVMFRFIDDIFFIWTHSKDELTESINPINSHESIKVDCNIDGTSVKFLTSHSSKLVDFLTTMCWTQKCILRRRARMNCSIKVFSPKNTFEGILKSQLIRFLNICNNMEDFHEATSILFKVRREKRNYSGRFLRQIKTKFFRNYRQPGITYDPIGAALKM